MLAFLLCLIFIQSASTHEIKDKNIVAEVNGAAIKRSDLESVAQKFLPNIIFHSTIQQDRIKKAEADALDYLINTELFFQEAQKTGITAERAEIEKRLAAVKQKYPSRDAYKKAFEKYDISEEALMKKIERDIQIEQFMAREIDVKLSDEEVKDYYDKNYQSFKEPSRVRLRYISIKFRPSEPDFRNKAKTKAEEAIAQLQSGHDFSEVARLYSDDMSRIKGGDVGYLHEGMLPAEVERVAFSIEEGKRSKLIEDDMGFHIIELVDKKPPRQVTFKEIKDKLKADLTFSYQRARQEELINRLREKATIIYHCCT
jgi:peptidyl-prolyl cis-trans isomerase C